MPHKEHENIDSSYMQIIGMVSSTVGKGAWYLTATLEHLARLKHVPRALQS